MLNSYLIKQIDNYENKYDVISDIYDQYVTVGFDIPFWVGEGKKAGEVLELTSGTGRVTLPLAETGVRVTALDISESLLDALRQKARAKGLDIEIVQGDLRSFRLGRKYPLIILPFHSFEELTSSEDQLHALERISEHLQNGGKFMVSIHNPTFEDATSGNNLISVFRGSKSNHEVKFYNNRSVSGHIATNEQVYREYDGNNLVSERTFINRSHVFQENEFEQLLQNTGFRTLNVWGGYIYEPHNRNSRFLVYCLTKE